MIILFILLLALCCLALLIRYKNSIFPNFSKKNLSTFNSKQQKQTTDIEETSSNKLPKTTTTTTNENTTSSLLTDKTRSSELKSLPEIPSKTHQTVVKVKFSNNFNEIKNIKLNFK